MVRRGYSSPTLLQLLVGKSRKALAIAMRRRFLRQCQERLQPKRGRIMGTIAAIQWLLGVAQSRHNSAARRATFRDSEWAKGGGSGAWSSGDAASEVWGKDCFGYQYRCPQSSFVLPTWSQEKSTSDTPNRVSFNAWGPNIENFPRTWDLRLIFSPITNECLHKGSEPHHMTKKAIFHFLKPWLLELIKRFWTWDYAIMINENAFTYLPKRKKGKYHNATYITICGDNLLQ